MAHKGARNDLTAEYVRSILDYDPETGVFRWKVNRPRHAKAGDPCGWRQPDGRFCLSIDKRTYRASRIAWLIVKGEWPTFEIDHKNRDPADTRWNNLRPATSSQNMANRSLQKNNTSGYKGVHFLKRERRYLAYTKKNGKVIRFGTFRTAEEAHRAVCAGSSQVHGEFFQP